MVERVCSRAYFIGQRGAAPRQSEAWQLWRYSPGAPWQKGGAALPQRGEEAAFQSQAL